MYMAKETKGGHEKSFYFGRIEGYIMGIWDLNYIDGKTWRKLTDLNIDIYMGRKKIYEKEN